VRPGVCSVSLQDKTMPDTGTLPLQKALLLSPAAATATFAALTLQPTPAAAEDCVLDIDDDGIAARKLVDQFGTVVDFVNDIERRRMSG